MKLYMLTQGMNDTYDTYDSVVVVAENAEDARQIHPDGRPLERKSSCYTSWVNHKDACNISVEYLGDTHLPSGVVLASFNAG